jgi:hypothetical protein
MPSRLTRHPSTCGRGSRTWATIARAGSSTLSRCESLRRSRNTATAHRAGGLLDLSQKLGNTSSRWQEGRQ